MSPEKKFEIRKSFFREAQVKTAVKIAMLEELEDRETTCGPFNLLERVQDALDEFNGERLIVDRAGALYARATFHVDGKRYEVEVDWEDLK